MSRTKEDLNKSLAAAQSNIKNYASQAQQEAELLVSNSALQLNQLESAEDKTQYANLVTAYSNLVAATKKFEQNLSSPEQIKAVADIQAKVDKLKKLKSDAVRSGLTNKLNADTSRNVSQLNQIQDRNNLKGATNSIKSDIKEGATLANKKVKTDTASSKGSPGKNDPTKKGADSKETQVQAEKWGVKFSFAASPSYPAKDDYYKKDESYYLTLLPAMSSAFSAQGNTDVPNSTPGLNFKLIPNLAKHKIPGFQPAYQHLGIDGCICTMVGCFTGADGYSLLEDEAGKGKTSKQALGNSTLFDSYGVAGLDTQEGLKRISQQLDSYKNFQQFYQFAIKQGKELTVEINLAKNGSLPIGTGSDETLRAGNGNPKFKALVKNIEVYHARSDRTWYTLQLELTDFGLASKTPINLTNQLSSKVKEYQDKLKSSGATNIPGSLASTNPNVQANRRLAELMQTPGSKHRIYQLGDDEVLYQVLSDGVNHYLLAKDEAIKEITGDQDQINKALDRRSASDKISSDDVGRSIMGALGCAGGVVLGALITGGTAGIGAGALVGAGALCASVGIGASFTPWGREEDISDFTTQDGITEFGLSAGATTLGGVATKFGEPLLKGAAGSVSRTAGKALSKVPGSGTVTNAIGAAAEKLSNSPAMEATRNLTTRVTNSRVAQATNQLMNKAGQAYDRLNVPIAQGRSPEYINRWFTKPPSPALPDNRFLPAVGETGGFVADPVPDSHWLPAAGETTPARELVPDNRLLPAAKGTEIGTRIQAPSTQAILEYQGGSGNVLKEAYENVPAGSQITSIGRRSGEIRQVTLELPSGETKVVDVNNEQLSTLMNGTNKLSSELPYPRASTPSGTAETLKRSGEGIDGGMSLGEILSSGPSHSNDDK